MGWNAEMEWKRQSLMRLVFMLFSLAALAERAAFAPRAMRREMLRALRPGALSAQSFVLDAAAEFGASPVPSCPFDPFDVDFSGDSPDDAMLLSHTFRSLGWALQFLLALSPQGQNSGAPEWSPAAAPADRRSPPSCAMQVISLPVIRGPPPANLQ